MNELNNRHKTDSQAINQELIWEESEELLQVSGGENEWYSFKDVHQNPHVYRLIPYLKKGNLWQKKYFVQSFA